MSKKIEILFLPAKNGDSILIKLGDPVDTSILIDGGTADTYQELHNELSELYVKCPKNYIFLTHCDDDHLGGLLEFFEKDTSLFKYITTVFYNYPSELEKEHPDIADHIQEPIIMENNSGNLSPDSLKTFTDLLKKAASRLSLKFIQIISFQKIKTLKSLFYPPEKKH